MRTRTNLPAGGFSDLDDAAGRDRGQFIVALARGLEVLRAFGPDDRMLGNLEIAGKTGLPKPTVSRITYTLAKLGYLEFVPRNAKYQLGAAVLTLGHAYRGALGVRAVAHAPMQALADELDCQVALGSREGLTITYVDIVSGPGVRALRLDVGARLAIERSAAGRAFLAGLTSTERGLITDAIERRDPHGWPAIRDEIDKAAMEVTTHGFYVGLGLHEPGFNAVAATLSAEGAGGYAVVNVAGPATQFPARRLYEEVGPRLREVVEAIGGAAAQND